MFYRSRLSRCLALGLILSTSVCRGAWTIAYPNQGAGVYSSTTSVAGWGTADDETPRIFQFGEYEPILCPEFQLHNQVAVMPSGGTWAGTILPGGGAGGEWPISDFNFAQYLYYHDRMARIIQSNYSVDDSTHAHYVYPAP